MLWNILEDLRRRENAKRGYVEVKTPLMYDTAVWITSGHWEKFRDDMFLVPYGEDRTLGLKPMNCPGHMLLFGSDLRSYRDLPFRYAESSTLHATSAPARCGLLRVQHVTGRRAHLLLPGADRGGDLRLPRLRRVSLRAVRHDGSLRALDAARGQARHGRGVGLHRGALQAALDRRGIEYTVNEGDGAFYGPKIDLHMTDVLGRSWQMGTIQLDSQMPARFGLTYMGADNAEHTPYVVHRALLGSLERFLGILIEHYAGDFPLWLAPVQVRVIPVGESHRAGVEDIRTRLEEAGARADVDERDETVSKRIRDAELRRSPAWSSTATRSRRRRWPSASAAAARRPGASTS